MYKVYAKLHSHKDESIQPFFIAKEYQRLNAANKFVESQKDHPKYYFEIVKVD